MSTGTRILMIVALALCTRAAAQNAPANAPAPGNTGAPTATAAQTPANNGLPPALANWPNTKPAAATNAPAAQAPAAPTAPAAATPPAPAKQDGGAPAIAATPAPTNTGTPAAATAPTANTAPANVPPDPNASAAQMRKNQMLSDMLSEQDAQLTDKDRAALQLADKWRDAPDHPALGAGGQVRFEYGATLPRVVCGVLHVTDIALQPGEVLQQDGTQVGDTANWQITPSVSGPPDNQVSHLFVKPSDKGLVASLTICTDRRVYHIELVSSENDWMPFVGFTYPDDVKARWAAYERQVQQKKAANTLPETGQDITLLDFDYRIDGEAPWKPLRVFNNGLKTVIQMPEKMKAGEAPALLVLNDEDKVQQVNFRVLSDRWYVVDALFQKAVLVLGVGRHQRKITITRLTR